MKIVRHLHCIFRQGLEGFEPLDCVPFHLLDSLSSQHQHSVMICDGQGSAVELVGSHLCQHL